MLTNKELLLIKKNAEDKYPRFTTDQCSGPVDCGKRNMIQSLIRDAYISGATVERDKAKVLVSDLESLNKFIDEQKTLCLEGVVNAHDEEIKAGYAAENMAYGIILMKIKQAFDQYNKQK